MTKPAILCLALLLSSPLAAADVESEILREREADIDLSAAPQSPAQAEEALLQNRIAVDQSGRDNTAMVDQSGSGNFASVSQAGTGAWAQIIQSGSGNTAVIFQR